MIRKNDYGDEDVWNATNVGNVNKVGLVIVADLLIF
jgi:hypothetical protein